MVTPKSKALSNRQKQILKSKEADVFGPRHRSVAPNIDTKSTIIYKSRVKSEWRIKRDRHPPIMNNMFDANIGGLMIQAVKECEISKSALLAAIKGLYWGGYPSSDFIYASNRVDRIFNYLIYTNYIVFIPRKPLELDYVTSESRAKYIF